MRSFWLLVSLIAGAPMLANAETFDTSFNGTGKVLFRIENTDLRAVAALPMPNGEIVQVMASVSNPVFLVARRYSATGAVVNIVVPTIEWSGIYAAAVDGSGRVVVVGTIDGGARGTDMAVMRLKPDLTIDGTFSGDGLATFDYIGTNDYAKAVAIDQRDNIVIVGSTFQSAADSDFLIVRMRSDGTMDSTFNSGGFRRIPFDFGSPFQDQATAVAIGNDGKIVIGGNALDNNFGRVRVAMARLLPNGAYDTTFCNGGCSTNAGYNTIQNGRTVYYFGLNTDHADELFDIEALGTRGFVIAGTTYADDGSPRRGAIARFAPSGTYDSESLQTGLGGNAMFSGVRSADAAGTRLLVSGTSGPGEIFFLLQAFTSSLAPLANYGSGNCVPDNSTFCFSSSASFGDVGPDFAGVLNLDSSGRPLFSGGGIANATDTTRTVLTARFTNTSGPKPDRIFRSGFN